ncbi:MAG: ABC transporter ATP-binding protein [Bdellovibrionales bacterium]|nr:ABC transporter ATP-binding protein [Bdellovibrionales bacterium]
MGKAPETKTILKVEDLHLSFTGTPVLNGVTFEIHQGETVGIIGPNGSGKTTLFNTLSGFHSANSGKIVFRKVDISNWPPYKRALFGLGRVFQNFGVFKNMTPIENIICALESKEPWWRGFFPWSSTANQHREAAMDFLKLVGLESKATDKASSLSGGQMRLLEIVRTLAFGAELFLLDEPTSGVSPKMKEDVARLIRDVKEKGKAILIIEHDINFIELFCDRVIVLDSGRVVLDDTPQNVRSNPMLQEVYFGTKGVERSPLETEAIEE